MRVPVFVDQSFDSRLISPLPTLLHRFVSLSLSHETVYLVDNSGSSPCLLQTDPDLEKARFS